MAKGKEKPKKTPAKAKGKPAPKPKTGKAAAPEKVEDYYKTDGYQKVSSRFFRDI
jgi:hypothetical protein